ncbi:MAG: hypothetical protein GC134_04355 [Proteobacteria bacterium]|nr:hypothetical protein [Pseudomonadota bacterium]
MSTSSWDEMKRVREEEYFLKEDKEKLRKLREHYGSVENVRKNVRESLAAFQKGFSPVTGAPVFKVTIDGMDVIDCPEESLITLSYEGLLNLLMAVRTDNTLLHHWEEFLKIEEPIGQK